MGLFGFGKSDCLYFPGCYSWAFSRDIVDNYSRILKKLRIDFKLQKDDKCCGGILEELGYEKQLRKISRENKIFLSEKGFKKIITSCPLCYHTLNQYKDIMPDWKIEVEFIIKTILGKLKESKLLSVNYFSEPVVYYDSCCLARYANIIEEPRELLKLLGYKLVELKKNRSETLCCGSCGGLPHTNKVLADKIAVKFIRMLQRKNIKKIITADPRDYQHLKENLEILKLNEEIKLIEFSEALCEALGEQ